MSDKWRKFIIGLAVLSASAAVVYAYFTKQKKKKPAALKDEFPDEDEEIDFFDEDDLDEEPSSREYLSIPTPLAEETKKEAQPDV